MRLSRLDEIEKRLKAAPPQAPLLPEHDPSKSDADCPACQLHEARRDLLAHAPADLALLARLLRIAVETECVKWEPYVRRCNGKPWDDPECLPCRIRRLLAAAEVGR